MKKSLTDAFLFFSAIDYIHFLHKEKKKQEEEVSVLRKEVMALKIMKTWDNGSKTFSVKLLFPPIIYSTVPLVGKLRSLGQDFVCFVYILKPECFASKQMKSWILKETLIMDKERKLKLEMLAALTHLVRTISHLKSMHLKNCHCHLMLYFLMQLKANLANSRVWKEWLKFIISFWRSHCHWLIVYFAPW